VCGCGHELAYHDPATGVCHEEDARRVWDERANIHVSKAVRCMCRQYDGPTPLPTMYAPEVTG
jgi:hypothetical protein